MCACTSVCVWDTHTCHILYIYICLSSVSLCIYIYIYMAMIALSWGKVLAFKHRERD